MTDRVRMGVLVACLAGALAVSEFANAQQPEAFLAAPLEPAPLICATDDDLARQLRLRPSDVVANGHPVSFQQEPAILAPDFSGTIALRDFVLAGDVETIRFTLGAESAEPETWRRTGTRQMAG